VGTAAAAAAKRRRPLGCLLTLAALVLPLGILAALPYPRRVLGLMRSPAPESLSVPVQGVLPRALVDSWGAPRSGGRRHRGIDIFARRDTPILSPVDGLVLDVGHDRLGGNVVKILGPGGQVHYFAHLERFGPLRERRWIARGEVVGYVGDSGNARGTPPHLHYGIYELPGRAVNPFPLLRALPR
jgi:murein DD-endopeptidase MepM/ murein hydrolase activator NlpD